MFLEFSSEIKDTFPLFCPYFCLLECGHITKNQFEFFFNLFIFSFEIHFVSNGVINIYQGN